MEFTVRDESEPAFFKLVPSNYIFQNTAINIEKSQEAELKALHFCYSWQNSSGN